MLKKLTIFNIFFLNFKFFAKKKLRIFFLIFYIKNDGGKLQKKAQRSKKKTQKKLQKKLETE